MMKKVVSLVVAMIMMMAVAVAQAEVREGSVSVTPFVGGYFFEKNQDLRDEMIYGLRVGYNITENFGLEAFGSYLKTEIQNVPGEPWQEVYAYGVDALYHFMPQSRFVPFLAVGVGSTQYGPPEPYNMQKLTVDYGAGLKLFLTENIALRADLRHVLPLKDNYNDFLCTFGINFNFGGKKKEIAQAKVLEPPPPPPTPVVVDSDKDGVSDNLDKCPGTPAGVTVDKDGCPSDLDNDGVPDYIDKCPGTPTGVAVDQNGCPLDSDKDGVSDYLDKCPGTPSGVAVDKDGCPLDSDKDGVADYLDKCPGTPVGVAVDKNGCPPDTDKDGVADYLDKCPGTEPDVIVDTDGCFQTVSISLSVEFDTAKSVVKDKYYDDIKRVADFMKNYPWTNTVIEGYTDSVGGKVKNKKLSEDRANSVRKYLIEKFTLDEARITAVGYGMNNPIADNDTTEGRQKNRRVQAFIETVKKKQ